MKSPFNYHRSLSFTLLFLLSILGQVWRAESDCLPPPAGLVAWWAAEGNANDSAGTNNGTMLGGVTFTNGMIGKGFYFNGAGSYIRVPPSPILGPSNQFTLEFWYKSERSGASEGMVARRNSESGPLNYDINITSGDNIEVFYNDPSVSGDTDVPGTVFELSKYSPAPLPGSFHHIAAAVQQSASNSVEIQTFVDGQLLRTRFIAGVLNRAINNAPLTIGCDIEYPAYDYFQGVIDEVSLYNRVLSTNEIQAIFNAGSSGKCPLSPQPPTISAQPQDQVVTVGNNAAFSVVASGSPNLNYQWKYNDTNILNATNTSLTLANVQASQAGSYAVTITNTYGLTNSANAILTVLPPPSCVSPSSNLVSWWNGDSNSLDRVSGNNGTLVGNVSFDPGRIGQGFFLDGQGDAITLGNRSNLALQDFTVETWIKRGSTTISSLSAGGGEIFASGSGGYAFGLSDSGALFLSKLDVDSITAGTLITDTNLHHVAVTKSGTTVIFYVDGTAFSSSPYSSLFTFSSPAAIGARGDSLSNSFLGIIDELSVYSRALSSTEIQALYNSTLGGKCMVPIVPFIVSQPTGQAALMGASVTMTASVGGSVPLSYQWKLNGTNISNATTNPLTLSNIQVSQTGNYVLSVTNTAGSVVSSNAFLAVSYPPAAIRVVNTNAFAASIVVVPITIAANGNENALAFSLNYDATRLVYLNSTTGPGASGAMLMANTSQTNVGRIGLELAMPTGTTLTPGTQIVALISFSITNLSFSASSTLSFGDVPISRQLLDAQLGSLADTFSSGAVAISVASAYEGDSFPRPGGDRTFGLADWLLMGRYVARMDYPTNTSEFQRADCAPRSSLGDGAIKATDWVQVGRYGSSLDSATAVGGPLTELQSSGPIGSSARFITVATATMVQGTKGTTTVSLTSQGNESALSFSLSFDPVALSFTDASVGSGAAGSAVFINTNLASVGQLGFALAFGIPNTFSAGTRELIRLNFISSTNPVGGSSISFTDQPALREVSDVNAQSLPVTFGNSTFAVNPLPFLQIGITGGTNVMLSWPDWASGFDLQETTASSISSIWTNSPVSPFTSNNEKMVILQTSPQMKFYRLSHP